METAGTCTTSASTVLGPPAPDVELTDDYDTKLSIPTGETDVDGNAVRKDMTHQELTVFCQGHAKQCDSVAADTQTETKNKYTKLLQHVGLCDDNASCLAAVPQPVRRRLSR